METSIKDELDAIERQYRTNYIKRSYWEGELSYERYPSKTAKNKKPQNTKKQKMARAKSKMASKSRRINR